MPVTPPEWVLRYSLKHVTVRLDALEVKRVWDERAATVVVRSYRSTVADADPVDDDGSDVEDRKGGARRGAPLSDSGSGSGGSSAGGRGTVRVRAVPHRVVRESLNRLELPGLFRVLAEHIWQRFAEDNASELVQAQHKLGAG